MKSSLKVLSVGAIAASLLSVSAIPAQAGPNDDAIAPPAFIAGAVFGAHVASPPPTYYEVPPPVVVYVRPDCYDRVIGGQPPTYMVDRYGRVFRTSSGFVVTQNTCTGQRFTHFR